MKFQKGQKRPANAGRKPGSKNKKSILKVDKYLSEQDINPSKEILELIETGDLRDKEKLDAWFELLSWCHAKPKEPVADDSDTDEFGDLEGIPEGTLIDFLARQKKENV